MDRWKKGLVLLMASAMVGSAVVATQFVAVRSDVNFTVNTNLSYVQFMASDGDPNSALGYVLNKTGANATGIYVLNMGTWMTRANKEFSAAFAIVNSEDNVDLTLTRITCTDVTGTPCTTLEVFVHGTRNNNCGTVFGSTDPTCNDGWSGGIAQPVTWILQDGTGSYSVQMPCAGDCLEYGDTTGGFCQSPYNTVAGAIWTTLTSCADNNAVSNTDNFVWVSVLIDTTGMAAGTNSGTLGFFFDGT